MNAERPFLLVTDLDHTLVGDDPSLQQLNQWFQRYRQQGSKLVYSTGRSRYSYQQLCSEKSLLTPDALVTAVGTEIYYADADTPDPTWSSNISLNWDRPAVEAIARQFLALTPQPQSEQRPFKVSYYLQPDQATHLLPQLNQALSDQGLETQLIYSGSLDLDILPKRADKGLAMVFVRTVLGFAPEATVVCGDSGNDCALFAVGCERGIMVGNAQPELLAWQQAHPSPWHYVASAACAAGILEGLAYFGYFQQN